MDTGGASSIRINLLHSIGVKIKGDIYVETMPNTPKVLANRSLCNLTWTGPDPSCEDVLCAF